MAENKTITSKNEIEGHISFSRAFFFVFCQLTITIISFQVAQLDYFIRSIKDSHICLEPAQSKYNLIHKTELLYSTFLDYLNNATDSFQNLLNKVNFFSLLHFLEGECFCFRKRPNWKKKFESYVQIYRNIVEVQLLRS